MVLPSSSAPFSIQASVLLSSVLWPPRPSGSPGARAFADSISTSSLANDLHVLGGRQHQTLFGSPPLPSRTSIHLLENRAPVPLGPKVWAIWPVASRSGETAPR